MPVPIDETKAERFDYDGVQLAAKAVGKWSHHDENTALGNYGWRRENAYDALTYDGSSRKARALAALWRGWDPRSVPMVSVTPPRPVPSGVPVDQAKATANDAEAEALEAKAAALWAKFEANTAAGNYGWRAENATQALDLDARAYRKRGMARLWRGEDPRIVPAGELGAQESIWDEEGTGPLQLPENPTVNPVALLPDPEPSSSTSPTSAPSQPQRFGFFVLLVGSVASVIFKE